jgi:hypothetical protein
MEFLSRLLGPRQRRSARPAPSRIVAQIGTAKNNRKARTTRRSRDVLHRAIGSLTRNRRSVDGKKLVTVYHHGTCTVNHRSRKAASRCRRTT